MKPSIKTLEAVFPGHGKALREIIETPTPFHLATYDYPVTSAWVASCYHRPKATEVRMSMINEVIEGYGTEAIFGDCITRPDFEYVNMGDTYITTIAFDYTKDRFIVTSYGDWIERQERKGIHYD